MDFVNKAEPPKQAKEVNNLLRVAERDQLHVAKSELVAAKHDQAMAKNLQQQPRQMVEQALLSQEQRKVDGRGQELRNQQHNQVGETSSARNFLASGAAALRTRAHEEVRAAHGDVQTFEAMKQATSRIMDFVSKAEPPKQAEEVNNWLRGAERAQLHIAKSELLAAKHDQAMAENLGQEKLHVASGTEQSKVAGGSKLENTDSASSSARTTLSIDKSALGALVHEEVRDAHAETQTFEDIKQVADEALDVVKNQGSKNVEQVKRLLDVAKSDELRVAKSEVEAAMHDETLIKGLKRGKSQNSDVPRTHPAPSHDAQGRSGAVEAPKAETARGKHQHARPNAFLGMGRVGIQERLLQNFLDQEESWDGR